MSVGAPSVSRGEYVRTCNDVLSVAGWGWIRPAHKRASASCGNGCLWRRFFRARYSVSSVQCIAPGRTKTTDKMMACDRSTVELQSVLNSSIFSIFSIDSVVAAPRHQQNLPVGIFTTTVGSSAINK